MTMAATDRSRAGSLPGRLFSVAGLWIAVVLAAALPSPLGGGEAAAASSPWVEADFARARLTSPSDETPAGGGPVTIGLEIELQEGWKTYWRAPGDVGLPPALDWSGSQNFDDPVLLFPAPSRFVAFGLENIGYEKAVTLPIAAAIRDPEAPTSLRLAADLLVCADICIPWSVELALDLPPSSGGEALVDGEAARTIAQALAALPDDGAASGFALATAAVERGLDGAAAAIVVEASSRDPIVAPDVFLELEGDDAFGRPIVEPAADGLSFTARTPLLRGDAAIGAPVVVTIVDGARAASLETDLSAPTPSPAAGGVWIGILGFALLGGLILNAMPCVLPVLALKLVSAVKAAQGGGARIRASFVVTAAGIVASMLALALLAIGMQAAGVAVGWGVQFQNPFFLAFLALVTAAFAINLFGAYEVALPTALAERLPATGGGEGWGKDFAAGALATLLATPCSAPFLGTAVAFALSRGPFEILMVFAALGVGLASPYLLVAAVPRLARLLPKPGAWMNRFKQMMGALLALTTLWLLWVLSGVSGVHAALAVAAALAALALFLALRAPKARIGAAAAALAVLAIPGFVGGSGAPRAMVEREAAWRPLAVADIEPAIARGEVVFVDVTADWCLTCKVNKALVLDTESVVEALEGEGIVAMRGDWTRPDDAIASFLAAHGRYGIPFNVAYGPGAPEGVVLPELLSVDAVLDALRRVRG